ncbi:MAG: hypothetical protein IJP29_05295 [Lachnospiraceae bacterium]|nr:hypothetical protein [Lachnospiraceae bacterium]
MNQELLAKCQLFVENKNALDKGFVWDGATIIAEYTAMLATLTVVMVASTTANN